MQGYSVIQSFLLAPTLEDPSVNSGLDTWTFRTREEAVTHFEQLVEELQADPDYKIGVIDEVYEVKHLINKQGANSFEIQVFKNNVPSEVVYVQVIGEGQTPGMWQWQQEQHEQRVLAHFGMERPLYSLTQSAVADDASSDLVASSLITWTFQHVEQAQSLARMLQIALQEDYAPLETETVRIVHFTNATDEHDYRIEVSENGVQTEIIMLELHETTFDQVANWWFENRQQHEMLVKQHFTTYIQ